MNEAITLEYQTPLAEQLRTTRVDLECEEQSLANARTAFDAKGVADCSARVAALKEFVTTLEQQRTVELEQLYSQEAEQLVEALREEYDAKVSELEVQVLHAQQLVQQAAEAVGALNASYNTLPWQRRSIDLLRLRFPELRIKELGALPTVPSLEEALSKGEQLIRGDVPKPTVIKTASMSREQKEQEGFAALSDFLRQRVAESLPEQVREFFDRAGTRPGT
jgi:hypothetical protein